MIDFYALNTQSIVILYRYMFLLAHFFMCFTYNTRIFFDNKRRYLEYITTNIYFYYKRIRRQLSISIFFLFSLFCGSEEASAGDDEPRAPSWCEQQLRIISASLPKLEDIVGAMQQRSSILLGHCQASRRFIVYSSSLSERLSHCLPGVSTSRVLFQEATSRQANPSPQATRLRNEYGPEARGLLRAISGGRRRFSSLIEGQVLETQNTTRLLQTCLVTLQRMAQWHMQAEERVNNPHPEDTQQPEAVGEIQALKEKLQEFKNTMRVCYDNGVNLTLGCTAIFTLLSDVGSNWSSVTENAASLSEELSLLEEASSVSAIQMRDFFIRQHQQRARTSSASSSSSGMYNTTHSTSSAISTGRSDSTIQLIQGYDVDGTRCSLQGVHYMLGHATNHMSILLKQLLAKSCSTVHPLMRNGLALDAGHSGSGFISRNTKNTRCSRMAISNSQVLYKTPSAGHVFSSLTGASSILDCKRHSTQTGYMLPLTSKVTVGVYYEYRHNNVQETPYIQYNASNGGGGVLSRTKTTVLSGIASWNTDTAGFTGQMVGCYGWGTMQTRRYSIHKEHAVAAKGRPNMQQKGGAIRLGYILPAVKHVQLTPYVEYMLVSSTQNAYKENSGRFLHMISGHKEHVSEKSIGLLSRWTIDDCSHLQTWVTKVFSRRNATELQSQPFYSACPLYKTVIPSNTSKNIQNEIGGAYEMTFQEVAKITVNGTLRFGKTSDMIDKNMQLTLQYMY